MTHHGNDMKTVAILQPSYLPWLGYFDQISRSDIFVFYDDVQYDKHGWRNRNRIKSATGEPQWLTVPVQVKGKSGQLVKDVQINNESDWRHKHVSTLRHVYSHSPYVKALADELTRELTFSDNLCELNIHLINWWCRKLKIEAKFVRSSELGIEGEQSERILKICQALNADNYLSGNLAKDYLDCEMFARGGVRVQWQDYNHPTYTQKGSDFLGYLSIVDLWLGEGEKSATFFATSSQSLPPTFTENIASLKCAE